MQRLVRTAVWMACGLAFVHAVSADQATDEAAIRTAVESYVAAFNRGDAKAVAAMWSPEAVYTDPASGDQLVGREAIEQQFSSVFTAEKQVKLEATTTDIQFISPSVAVEQGIAKIIRPEQPPEETEYTAVYVRRDGQWLLDRVTEEEVPVVRSNYEHLKELEWMIGNWVDGDDQGRVVTSCQWTKNRNFITRMFALTIRDRIEISGMQIVGWDPAAQQIRSWVFDSDGGFGQGVWKKKGKAWHVLTTGTAADGSKSSAVNILTEVDQDTFTWQSVNRVAGGEMLPNVDEVVVVRQAEE